MLPVVKCVWVIWIRASIHAYEPSHISIYGKSRFLLSFYPLKMGTRSDRKCLHILNDYTHWKLRLHYVALAITF